MKYFYILGVLLFNMAIISATEVTENVAVVEYIQELTGKIDALTQLVEELQKRIEILENACRQGALEKKESSDNKIPTINTTKEKPKKLPPSSADRLWSDAIAALQLKKYDIAEQKFADFIHFYAEHANAAEGYYWLGEIKLLNKQYQQAQVYYAGAYKGFLETDTRKADSGLKIAECYFALNKNKEGCLFLKEIMKLQQKGAAISTATLQLMQQYWAKHKCPDL